MKKPLIAILIMLFMLFPNTEVKAMRDDLKETFINSLVMQLDNPMAYTRSLDVLIDYQNNQVYPFSENGVVYVPLRFLFEYQGGHVKWDNQTRQVVIYYSDQKYFLSDEGLYLNNQIIELHDPIVMRDNRFYVSIAEWNEKVLGKQFRLHGKYIVLLPKDQEIPTDFWPLMDRYFRCFSDKHGELEMIYSEDKQLCGLADVNGTVIIEPKYGQLYYRPDRPIIALDMKTRPFSVMTTEEEVLFQIDGGMNCSFMWLSGEPNSFGQNLGGRLGENEPCRVYDIIGEDPCERVGEFLGVFPNRSKYVNGLTTEIEKSGRSILKNRSGNILYSAKLPENLMFPVLYLLDSSTQVIQDDCLVIYEVGNNGNMGCKWGTLDMEGNLVPFPQSE